MVELILNFILKIVVLGLGYYLVHSIFSKNTKDFHCSIDQNGFKVDSTFYEEQVSSLSIVSSLCKESRRSGSNREQHRRNTVLFSCINTNKIHVLYKFNSRWTKHYVQIYCYKPIKITIYTMHYKQILHYGCSLLKGWVVCGDCSLCFLHIILHFYIRLHSNKEWSAVLLVICC